LSLVLGRFPSLSSIGAITTKISFFRNIEAKKKYYYDIESMIVETQQLLDKIKDN